MRLLIVIAALCMSTVCSAVSQIDRWIELSEQSRVIMEPELAIQYADSVVFAGAGPAKAAQALILKGRCLTMLDKPIQALQSFEKAAELPVDEDPIP